MKLAILADIHANLQALEAVLLDLKNEKVNQVIVNGDLVNRGPSNTAVIEILKNEDVTTILGNHDDLILKWIARAPDLPQDWFTSPFWKATDWAAKQLERDGLLDDLRELPMTHKVELEGAPSLLISHGSPRHYREGYSERILDDDLIDIATEFPADILIGSHTHSQLDRSFANKRVLNTGAVGTPFNKDTRAQYLILHLENQMWKPEFKRIPYNQEAALKAYETSGLLEEGGLSAYLFQQEVKTAHSLFTPFFMWTEEQELPQNWDTWERFKVLFPERCAIIDEGV